MNTLPDENDNMKKAKDAIQRYFHQLTVGCGHSNCTSENCASNPKFKKLNSNQAAIQAVNLAKDKSQLCKNMDMTSNEEARTSQESKNQMRTINDEDIEDDDDVITSSSTSRATSASVSRSTDLKSVDDALKDAIKFVSKINEKSSLSSSSSHNPEANKKLPYLSENRIANLIKKCKQSSSQEEKMEVDNEPHASSTTDKHNFAPLINLAQSVFQSYESLAHSFQFTTTQDIEMSKTMPCMPPFNIDFNSIRRSYSLMFAIPNENVIDELEKTIDFSVSTLCVSIRMLLKKNELKESELDQILHALLVVNELPMLEDPKYMEKCAKIFYSTMSELPAKASVKIVRMWSLWSADEIKIFLNRLQQFITITVISKQLEEPNLDNEDEDEEENERICLHKNEGVSGAVGCLRLIFYASILGGRLDSAKQIEKERKLEDEEMAFMQSTQVNEEQSSALHESSLWFNMKQDPLEELLNIKPIDCREPKIANEQFVNEVANKYVDMQHDYVEYIQHMQSLEHRSYQFNKNKKQIFSFLSHPFFLMLSKKMLGLYYDNKIKMMRERRNNIMMSLFDGTAPNPYFKMRLSRSNLLAEALNLMELQEQENHEILRRQLFIEFENEQGIDQGGVSKEFFQLAIDELLNKGYTFFIYDETSHYYWFTPCTIETEKEFRLIGFLFGIAIYNSVVLDVQFPPVFFRKLMGKIGTFEDLHFSHPQLYQSLTSMLEFNGSDEEFEDTFMLTFQISITDNFGTLVNFNLKENGDKIAVTKSNRQEFVDLYADFILNKGIEESFKAFRRGFLKIVMNSPLLKWFSPEELEILLCGSRVLDWNSLEKSTAYDSGFENNHEYIKQFWEVFNDFTSEEKKLFLKFTTGTDRCPHGGLSELKLTIARNGPDTEKLPTAHTCFNVLLLPEYSSKQKLKEKLLKAIQYSRGFGLS